MRRLLIATTNPDKLREIRGVLAEEPAEILSLRDLPPMPEPKESAATFHDNARLKAHYYDAALAPYAGSDEGRAPRSGPTANTLVRPYTVAEDSGLVIDALGGEPGVYSARFLRDDASYPERFAEIYRRLATVEPDLKVRPYTARFVCALAVVCGGELVYETTGIVEGEIAAAPRGTGGFGYDPIFYYPAYGRTLAEVTEEEKRRVAHRGRAFRNLAQWLRSSIRATGTVEK